MPYKVVRRTASGELISALITEGPFRSVYGQGEWTDAPSEALEKGYGLTCFRSLVAAKRFRRGMFGYSLSSIEIWRCATKRRLPLPRVCHGNKVFDGIIGREAWLPLTFQWPPATVMAGQIKLLERVE